MGEKPTAALLERRRISEKTFEKENKKPLEERGTQVSKATIEGQECSRLDSANNQIDHRI